jgi:hypothetical protein
MMRLTMTLAMTLLAVGCGPIEDGDAEARAAGPHPEDEGLVTYWRVTGSDSSNVDCTDASDWASVTAGNEFPLDSFFMYRVEPGGAEARGQSCETLDPSSCSDSGELFSVSDNMLTYDADADVIPGDADCDLLLWSSWMLHDDGETGTFALDISFSYSPDDGSCDYFEEAVVAGSTNGFGMESCTLSVTADLALEKIE